MDIPLKIHKASSMMNLFVGDAFFVYILFFTAVYKFAEAIAKVYFIPRKQYK
ncbi:MAG: hypothetical protein J6Q81_05155 [Lentisphaeria bacterium]|nr:hypothetical protein [Lentisphaeria bacterium]